MRITRLMESFFSFEDVFNSASFMLVPLFPFIISPHRFPITQIKKPSSLRFYLIITVGRASDGYVRTASSGTPARKEDKQASRRNFSRCGKKGKINLLTAAGGSGGREEAEAVETVEAAEEEVRHEVFQRRHLAGW